MHRFAFPLLISVISLCPWLEELSVADPITVLEPDAVRPCTGFDPERNRWGPIRVNTATLEDHCPKGSAIMAHEFVLGRDAPPERLHLEGYCCPLPADALTNEHQYMEARCPDGSVVTGGIATQEALSGRVIGSHVRLRCTTINSTKYVLGEDRPGWIVGWEREDFSDRFKETILGLPLHYTTWNRIPAGLRSGFFRLTEHGFRKSGCAGFPWGSLLIGSAGKDCGRMHFRALHYRTASGGAGEPVAVYPPCAALDDELSPNARCAPDSMRNEEISQ